MFSIVIVNGFIVEAKKNGRAQKISEEEYYAILEKFANRPIDTPGYTYKLRADTLEWELVELPPEPDPELTDEELVEILLGGAT